MRLKLISCEIFYREFCSVISRSVNTIEVEFLLSQHLGPAPHLPAIAGFA